MRMLECAHGGDVYAMEGRAVVDFSANINPLGLPGGVKRAMARAVDDCARYPDPQCRALRAAIGAHERVPPESILCGAGAAELIYRVAWAVKPRRTLIAAPTFSEYQRAAEGAGGAACQIALDEANGFALGADFLRAIEPGIELVFLCNPNNPTGGLLSREWVEEAARRCDRAGALLAVDECFMDFVEGGEARHSAKPLLDAHPNLIVLKAFTKIFAMPGVRLGYCMASSAAWLDRLRAAGPPWSVSAFAQAAGIAAAGEAGVMAESRAYVAKERAALQAALKAVGLVTFESAANFILFRAARRDLRERLLEKGYLIRGCANFAALDARYYRIAVRRRAENDALIAVLAEVLSE
jgi:threonine-phosphate decarboxylase